MSDGQWSDLPVYEAGQYNGGINLNKDDNDAIPFEAAPPAFNDDRREVNSMNTRSYEDNDMNAKPYEADVERGATSRGPTGTTSTVQPASMSTNNAMIFHIVSITCCILSILFTPLIEIIPAVLVCIMGRDLKRASTDVRILHWIDFVVTVLAVIILLALIIVIAVFTFGIGAVLLVLLIPYFFVLGALGFTNPNGDSEKV